MAVHLTEIFPDADLLIQLSPEDLAPIVLKLARDAVQNGHVHPQAIFGQVDGPNGDHSKAYPQLKKGPAENALNAAWNWLVRQGLVIPDTGVNGSNGWHHLTAKAEEIAITGDFESFKQAAAFPKLLIHPVIRDDVWLDLARGQYDTAVFKAMRAVEIAVRAAGKFADSDVGVDLMRKAFKSGTGPLADLNQLPAEQDMLMHLFAGAIGYYKNPQSHRSVNVDAAPAREVVILASHLLRIVDERRKAICP